MNRYCMYIEQYSFSEVLSMTDLEIKIKEAAQKYYTDGSSDLTDEEFDALVDQLRVENPDSELFRVGWGYDVYADQTPGDKVKHKYGTAGSLSKAYSYNELQANIRNGKVLASLKLDGISVVCYYNKGHLYQALTRGDGDIGIDITDKVKCLTGHKLPSNTFTGAVRGEIVMSNSNFEKFKALHPQAKNSRNSTAGLINGKTITQDIRLLDIIFYQVVGDETTDISPINYSMYDMVTWLEHMYGEEYVAPYIEIELHEDSFIDQMNSLKDIWYGVYPADGIVLTNFALLDPNTRYVSYDAQAFKFDSEEKETEVLGIDWRLTKTRYLMPRVNLKTVELAGTSVSWATGYNALYIKQNCLGPGAIVTVEKHGEIIPNINKVIKHADNGQTPTCCPSCGTELNWVGVHLQCPNEHCSNAFRQDLTVWIDVIAPVDGLGDAIRVKFLEQIFGHNLSVETVMESKSKGVMIFGRTGHKKLIQDMFNKLYGCTPDNRISLVDALLALNIPRIGDITSVKFAQYPDIIRTIMNNVNDNCEFEEGFWYSVGEAIGRANALSVIEHAGKFKRLKYIEDRIIWEPQTTSSDVADKGKVAITGKLSVKRADFEKELRSAGYTPAEISKDTKFLITDDPTSSSSKNKKADAWGIEKISETEFRNRYL